MPTSDLVHYDYDSDHAGSDTKTELIMEFEEDGDAEDGGEGDVRGGGDEGGVNVNVQSSKCDLPAPPPPLHWLNSTSDNFHPLTGAFLAPPKQKRRKPYNPIAVRLLERHFSTMSHPGKSLREVIAREVGISEKEVLVWFQNRRRKRSARDVRMDGGERKRKTSGEGDEATTVMMGVGVGLQQPWTWPLGNPGLGWAAYSPVHAAVGGTPPPTPIATINSNPVVNAASSPFSTSVLPMSATSATSVTHSTTSSFGPPPHIFPPHPPPIPDPSITLIGAPTPTPPTTMSARSPPMRNTTAPLPPASTPTTLTPTAALLASFHAHHQHIMHLHNVRQAHLYQQHTAMALVHLALQYQEQQEQQVRMATGFANTNNEEARDASSAAAPSLSASGSASASPPPLPPGVRHDTETTVKTEPKSEGNREGNTERGKSEASEDDTAEEEDAAVGCKVE
ncbi:hypothetical protein DFJ77DRAFT_508371 [Powellomyces hirtus]|nr:hypothetical protein DFJ77DRAFT_508371 [Powellomyces hirtus]